MKRRTRFIKTFGLLFVIMFLVGLDNRADNYLSQPWVALLAAFVGAGIYWLIDGEAVP